MKPQHLLGLCAVAVLTAACGYGIKTTTDYDRSVRFSNYQSFFVLKGNSSGDPLMDQRAQAAVATVLTSKGWLEVPEGMGQAAVVVHAATRTKQTYEMFYDGWSDWNWRWGLADETTFVTHYQVGTLVVDIFDARTKQAIWHGFAKDALWTNPSSNARPTELAVEKMFRNFPPATVAASNR